MLTRPDIIHVVAEGEVCQPVGRLIQRDGLKMAVAFDGPEQQSAVVTGGIETMADKLQFRHSGEMFDQFVGLSAAVRKPDSAVGHTISRQISFLATGTGSDLACHRNLFIHHFVNTGDKMHAPTVIKEHWGLPYFTCTDDMEVERTRGDDLFSGDIKQGDAVLADDQQQFAVVHALQAEGFMDAIHMDDTWLMVVGDDQMARITDGTDLPVGSSVDIPEPVMLITHQPAGLYLSPFYLMAEDLAKGAHREYTAILG